MIRRRRSAIVRPIPAIVPAPPASRGPVGRRAAVTALGLALLLLALPGCPPASSRLEGPGPTASSLRVEPTVRVRIGASVSQAVAAAPGGVWVGPADLPSSQRLFASPVTLSIQSGALTLQPAGGQAVRWGLTRATLRPATGDVLQIDQVAYPGTAVIHANAATLDVINHAPIEQYLPGVLHRELYASWAPAAFEAQAVAARSYALVECNRNRLRHYDLEATTASQAYGGAAAGDRAMQAVRATRGLVLVYDGRVLPAYYSSCCGGTGQDAAAAFTNGPDLPPLRGREHGAWCAGSKYFRWGPIQRDRGALAAQIAAWGRANHHVVAQLRDIRQITIAARNGARRPGRYAITDGAGRVFELGPEQFRFACNFAAPGRPPTPEAALLRSSHVSVNVTGNQVVFTDGRGFGHGVGLCQWGAQGLAQKGYAYQQILGFYYYPGASLQRLY